MDEQPDPGIPVPEEAPPEPTLVVDATPEAPEPEQDDPPVTVTYRGIFPGSKDQVTGQRWECGQEREVPYSVAARLVTSRFFSSPAFPESIAITR